MNLFYQCLIHNIFLLFFVYKPSTQQKLKDCFPIRGEASSLTCRSIPTCNDPEVGKILSKYTRVVFDLENKFSIDQESNFFNCTFGWSSQITLDFKNIRFVNKYAFEQVKVAKGVRLSIRFDGGGLNLVKTSENTQKLLIRAEAFRNVELSRNSQLSVEIVNYKSVFVQDILVDSVSQDETSEVNLSVRNCDRLIVKNKNEKFSRDWILNEFDLIQGEVLSEMVGDEYSLKHASLTHEIPMLKGNLSYSFEIARLDSVQIDAQVFANLQVNPYSDMSLVIKLVHHVSLGKSAFDSLMLGSYSQFNLLIESVSSISLGERLFNSLQQEQTSVFFFQMDQIGNDGNVKTTTTTTTTTTTPSEEYEYYDDYEYVSSDYKVDEASSSFSNWLCLPEGLFRNVQHYESALTQIHLTKIFMSVSVSSFAFNEIQLSENSKFQLLFEDVKGHIIFDKDAVNLIKVSDGMFEIWNENHVQQQELVRGNQNIYPSKGGTGTTTSTSNMIFKSKSKKKTIIDAFKLMKSVKHIYFKLLDYSINQIFLTPRSDFRIGYVSSSSLFIIKPKSFNGFHIDRFDSLPSTVTHSPNDQAKEYNGLTKLTLKLDESNENLKFQFSNDLTTEEEHQLKSENLPKIIELDGAEPTLFMIKADGSIVKFEKKDSTKAKPPIEFIHRFKSDSSLKEEFCRFYSLKQFMSEIEFDSTSHKPINEKTYKLTNNLIYFSQLNKNSMQLDQQMQCTSCLLIYLYRTIHRRADFYFVKDNLPACFINLHFKDSLYFESTSDNKKRDQMISKIEGSFKFYWKELQCSAMSGLNSILEYNPLKNEIDETQSDFDRIETNCKLASPSKKFADEVKAVKNFEDWSWHENAQKICIKNFAENSFSNISNKVPLSLRKNDRGGDSRGIIIESGGDVAPVDANSTLSVIFITGLITFSLSLTIFVYVKFKAPKRPCIRLNFRRSPSTKNFQRLTNSRNTTSSTTAQRLHIRKEENDDDDDQVGNEHAVFDELNGYEYDDEFEIQQTEEQGNVGSRINKTPRITYSSEVNSECVVNECNEDDFNHEISSSTSSKLGRITHKSLEHIKRFKTTLLSRDGFLKSGLLNVTNMNHPLYKNNKHYPHYTYNSTDSTLVQTSVPNEFQVSQNENESLELENVNKSKVSVVTYDIGKKKSRQNVVKNSYNLLVGETNTDLNENKVMRLAENPLDSLDLQKDLSVDSNEPNV